MTTDSQLTDLGYKFFKSDYLGTYSSDLMPTYIKNNQCFILNTGSSRSDNKYSHWIEFYKINGKLYFMIYLQDQKKSYLNSGKLKECIMPIQPIVISLSRNKAVEADQ